MMSLPDDIGNLEKLKSLNLQGSCLNELPESITKLTNLVELLAYGIGLQSLPENFGNLRGLKILELKGNCDVLTLPESFIQLTQLVDLSLPSTESLVKPVGYDNFLWVLGRSGCAYEESDC
jgi:Leucine-rich repeat (LRR) protein